MTGTKHAKYSDPTDDAVAKVATSSWGLSLSDKLTKLTAAVEKIEAIFAELEAEASQPDADEHDATPPQYGYSKPFGRGDGYGYPQWPAEDLGARLSRLEAGVTRLSRSMEASKKTAVKLSRVMADERAATVKSSAEKVERAKAAAARPVRFSSDSASIHYGDPRLVVPGPAISASEIGRIVERGRLKGLTASQALDAARN